jgi:hypothetical protein
LPSEEFESNQLCLRALFTHQWELARRTCAIHIGPAVPTLHQIGPDDFHVTSPISHGGRIKCRDPKVQATTKKHFTVGPSTTVHVPPGCSALTEHFTFSSADAGFEHDIKADSMSASWPISAADLSQNLDLTRLSALRADLGHVMANWTHIPLRDALDAVNNYRHISNPSDWGAILHANLLSVLAMLTSGAALTIIWIIHGRPSGTSLPGISLNFAPKGPPPLLL